MTYKKRILFCGEASFLSTGFSTYYRELLPRLAATGKYEIAELGSYAAQNDPRVQEFIAGRWKFYGVMPLTPEESQVFGQPSPHPRTRGQNTNQFGEYKFNGVVADFKPDIVIDIRDFWMLEHQERSVFRPWFKWIIMPTVDAEPQSEEWIQTYESANLVLAYSDYGVHALRRQTVNLPGDRYRMKIFPKPMRPGVDINVFKPQNKAEVRDEWNIHRTAPIIGTVMRNQSLGFNAQVQTLNGYKYADAIIEGDKLLTSQGRFMPVTNIWSYKEEKPYTHLTVFGNNVDGPNATSEHKFHFENSKHAIGDAVIKERIKMPVLPFIPYDKIDIAQYLSPIEHWELQSDKLTYDWRGGHAEVERHVVVDEDIMRLFGWYLAEGWISNHGKTVQFGLNTNETEQRDEIVDIIKRKFGGHVTINDDKEFDSRTLSWSSHIHAKWFMSLFGNGSRNKYIPCWLKADPRAIYMVGAYLEGDGSFYNPDNKNSYVLASSFSTRLAHDVRDILLANGIFTTIGQSVDHDYMKTNIGIYGRWASKLNDFIKHNNLKPFSSKPKGCNWKNNVDWLETEDQSYFLVPITNVSHTTERGPFYDFEVQEDHTYNCAGYACDNSRKLYPDLIDAFARMKTKYKGEKSVDESILILHSSWPDNMHSFDYPRHIMRLETMDWLPYYSKGIRGSILQTLHCHSCQQSSWTYAMNLHGQPVQGGRIKLPCARCGAQDASPPQTAGGFTRKGLASLYNMMDLYVQCSICEGDGIPIQEAKSCGVPTLVTDYTAMREKGRYPDYSHFKDVGINADNYTIPNGGEVIDVGRYYHEPETSCIRAHPDVEDLATKMHDLICDPKRLKEMSVEARKCVEDNYDWDKLIDQWESVLDGVKHMDRSVTWDSPIQELDPIKALPMPEGLSDDEFIEWLYLNILRYEVVDTAGAQMWKQHLEQGIARDAMMKQFVAIGNQQSDASKVREQIRAQVAGQSPVTQVSNEEKVQEFV